MSNYLRRAQWFHHLGTVFNRGAVLCDVKLANVLDCENGVVKLLEFSLAVKVEAEDGVITSCFWNRSLWQWSWIRRSVWKNWTCEQWVVSIFPTYSFDSIISYKLLLGSRRWNLAISAGGLEYISGRSMLSSPGEKGMGDDARDLLMKVLNEEKRQCASAPGLLTHPWVLKNAGKDQRL